MKELSYNDKVIKFTLGEFAFKVPPVCTDRRTESAWIAYIDDCGEWL